VVVCSDSEHSQRLSIDAGLLRAGKLNNREPTAARNQNPRSNLDPICRPEHLYSCLIKKQPAPDRSASHTMNPE
jgi:hypothetical protein